jgi:hypothetical protein
MHDHHHHADDVAIPVSAGIPATVHVTAAIGLVMIFTILTLVFRNSAANHVWPSSKTLETPVSTTLQLTTK